MEKQFFISFISLINEVQGKTKLPSQVVKNRKSAWVKQVSNPKQKKDALSLVQFFLSFLLLFLQSMMKLTKAQKEILLTLENGDVVNNWSQRMRALQPLIDAGIVYIKVTNDKNGITEDVRVALVDQFFSSFLFLS